METSSIRPATTILLVDNDDSCRVTSKWFLENFGYCIESARNAEDALFLFDPKLHDVVVTNNAMPGISGMEMAHVIKLRSPHTPVVMYSGDAPEDLTCIDALIQRPAHILDVKAAVDRLARLVETPLPSDR